MHRLSASLSFFCCYFLMVFLGIFMGCQKKVEYTYITGARHCSNGKQDPDEYGVDCGGAFSRPFETCVI